MKRHSKSFYFALFGLICIITAIYPNITFSYQKSIPVSTLDVDTTIFTFLGEYDQHEYYISKFANNWISGRDICIENGGYLACITSEEENNFIATRADSIVPDTSVFYTDYLYIGMSDLEQEGTWEWVSGEEMIYTNWLAGEPGGGTLENFGMMWLANDNRFGKWNDLTPELCRFVIEVPIQPEEELIYLGEFNNSDYFISTHAYTWTEGRDICIENGGYLACITSAEENDFIASAADTVEPDTSVFYDDYLYIGMSDVEQEGTWVWESGEPMNYTNWEPGEPGGGTLENFGMMWLVNDDRFGKWNDLTPELCRFVLEIPREEELIYLGDYNNSEYYISRHAYTWAESRVLCIENGGYLACITSTGENNFIATAADTVEPDSSVFYINYLYIGMSDVEQEGIWVWESSEDMIYTNWEPGEPNGGTLENYGMMWLVNDDRFGQWNDLTPELCRFVLEIRNEPISITLTPANPPIIIPETGGSFDYNIEISNNTADPQTFDVWTEILFPNGGSLQLFDVPNVTLPATVSADRDKTQTVPPGTPAGTYTYAAYVGDYQNWIIEDMESFTFVKEGMDGIYGAIDPSEWISYGESFENEGSILLIPNECTLLSAYPNPFNPETTLAWTLPQSGEAALIVYDIQGREVVRLVDGYHPAGFHQIEFNASSLTSGVYFARLISEQGQSTQKLLLLK